MKELLARLEQRWGWDALTVDGHVWRWLDTCADGPTAVLLPGSVGDGAMFVRTLLTLGDSARLIAVTYPAISDPHALAHGLAAVSEHLMLPPSLVVGSSFAAYWAQFYALHYPESVRTLVVGNGFVDGTDLTANPLFDPAYVESVSDEELHAQWLARVRAMPPTPLQQLQEHMLAQRQSPRNLRARFLGVVRAQACPPLPLEARQVTVLDCHDDPLIPPEVRARVRAQYPQSHHVSLPFGAHYPHLLNPKAYEDLILGLL